MSTLQDIEDVQRGEAWYITNATEAWAVVAEYRRTTHIMSWIIIAMGACMVAVSAICVWQMRGAA